MPQTDEASSHSTQTNKLRKLLYLVPPVSYWSLFAVAVSKNYKTDPTTLVLYALSGIIHTVAAAIVIHFWRTREQWKSRHYIFIITYIAAFILLLTGLFLLVLHSHGPAKSPGTALR
ncbi:hypothetical protein F5883DRAFT_125526 [Diaporthe sp. PMI_573]|nr:hypothetical protein F5883DRAFT_125526 [Diaporthaceae sp. PMI_573]